MCIMTRHDSNCSPRLPKWTAWFRRRNSAGCLGFLRRSQGWETSVSDAEIIMTFLRWSSATKGKHFREWCSSSFFSKLQSEIWRITNKEGKEAREHADRVRARVPAEVPSLDHRSGDACSIQLEPSAGAAWSVHRTGGFEKYSVSFPRISWFKMFKTSFFQCFLWPLHVMGWIQRVLDTPTKKQTTWTNSNFCRGAVSRERNSPGFRAPGAGRTPGNN